MAWIAVDKDGTEIITTLKPTKGSECWRSQYDLNFMDYTDLVVIPKGTIKKLIGREMTWNDEPEELK